MIKLTEFPDGKKAMQLANRGEALCWAAKQRPNSSIEYYYYSEDGYKYNRQELYVKYFGDEVIYDYSNEISLLFKGLLLNN